MPRPAVEKVRDHAAAAAPAGAASPSRPIRLCFVAPRHRADPDWAWITAVGPMRAFRFERVFIDNTFAPVPKLTRPYKSWQYRGAAAAIGRHDLAFLFSTDVAAGVCGWAGRLGRMGRRRPPLVYVGFTQDGHWPAARIRRTARALRRCRAVTVFSEAEREVLVPRYGLEPRRVRVVPIHTDETDGYGRYPDERPRPGPYVLSMGSPNRRFVPVARACRDLHVPLVVITRPWHANDSLEELAELGATVITDAGRVEALTWLKHAALAVMAFDDPAIPGGFTTLVHAMFMQTPFVVTACLGMAEHVIDGETGYVAAHGDDAALAWAIDRLWNDPDLAADLGRRALARAEARHSPDAAAGAFAGLARAVLGA